MNIAIELVENVEQEMAAARIRREVFGTEWAFAPAPGADTGESRVSELIARVLPDGDAVATVAVLDTTGDPILGERYGLPFSGTDRVARYTHMAVVEPYHGLDLPLYLLLEARRLCVVPRDFAYTWLLFPEGSVRSSQYRTLLSFAAGSKVAPGERGPSRALFRDERSEEAEWADAQAGSFLARRHSGDLHIAGTRTSTAYGTGALSVASGPEPVFALVGEDEWVTQ